MAASVQAQLVDTIYRAALEPAAWQDVVQLMKQRFPSAAQTFYFLHLEPRRVRPVCLAGIEAHWLRSFDHYYFAADNPWMRVSRQLHLPGVVRTNERLDRFVGQRGVLYGSAYFNEWMRPQGFKYTIGNTLLAQAGLVANVTLLRPPDMKTFSSAEVRAFEALSRHMTRALQMSIRLQCLDSSPASLSAFDLMPQAIALVDAQRRIHYANPAMDSVLQGKLGLAVRQGELSAAAVRMQKAFEACIAGALCSGDAADDAHANPVPLEMPIGDAGHLEVRAMPVRNSPAWHLPWRPMVLLVATEHADLRSVSAAEIRQRYGCTPAEARLAQLLAQGCALQEAARTMGVTYGTARAYLKIVFDKTGVATQAQLVARLLGGPATAVTRS
jgi:DNA-binding CsgD family transcriptional regulator